LRGKFNGVNFLRFGQVCFYEFGSVERYILNRVKI